MKNRATAKKKTCILAICLAVCVLVCFAGSAMATGEESFVSSVSESSQLSETSESIVEEQQTSTVPKEEQPTGTTLAGFSYTPQPATAEEVQQLVQRYTQNAEDTALPKWKHAIPESWVPAGWQQFSAAEGEVTYYSLHAVPQTDTLSQPQRRSPTLLNTPITTEDLLQAALNDATFPEVNLTQDIELTKPLTINRTMALNGNGYTLKLASSCESRHLNIGSSGATIEVALQNIKIRGHINGQLGGGITVGNQTTLRLEAGTVVSYNHAGTSTSDNGGGIYTYSGKIIVESGARVTQNMAGNGGGISATNGTVIVKTGGSILQNDATNNGGGITAKTIEVYGEVNYNVCYYMGGGIFVGNGGIKVNGGSISYNLVLGKVNSSNSVSGGGGIRAPYGNVELIDASIKGNSAPYSPHPVYFGGNYIVGTQFGGGLYVGTNYTTNHQVTITNSTISGNVAKEGGGLYIAANLTITGSTMENNSAVSDNPSNWCRGGALLFDHGTTGLYTASITGGEMLYNVAKQGGAIGFNGSDQSKLTVDGTAFSGNVATNGGAPWVVGSTETNAQETYTQIYNSNVNSIVSCTTPYSNIYNNCDVQMSTDWRVVFIISPVAFPSGYDYAIDYKPIGNLLAAPDDIPDNPGYHIEGWYTSENFLPEEKWDLNSKQQRLGGVYLYAKWVEDTQPPPVNPPVNPPVEPTEPPPVDPPKPPIDSSKPTVDPPAPSSELPPASSSSSNSISPTPAPVPRPLVPAATSGSSSTPESSSSGSSSSSRGPAAAVNPQNGNNAPPSSPLEEGPGIDRLADGETPLFGVTGSHWSLANLIIAVLGFAISALLLVNGLIKRRQHNTQGPFQPAKAAFVWRVIGITAGLLATIMFVLFEDMSLKTAVFDAWTPLMVVILAVQLLALVLLRLAAFRNKNADETNFVGPAATL